MNDIDLVRSLVVDLSKLPDRDEDRLDALRRRAKMIFTKTLGQTSPYLTDLDHINFYPSVVAIGMEDSYYDDAWHTGKAEVANLFNTVLEELQLKHQEITKQENAVPIMKEIPNQVFVVHGHDDEMKITVARTLEKLGLAPIILHEQADRGRTVIEKFIGHSQVPFAVVLFSPDDLAYSRDAKPETARPRARQNVVLELGFFLGKLGRENVVVLHRQVPSFEMPSDYAGVLFKPFDDHGAWRFELARELGAAGFVIDVNRLLK